MLDFFLVFTKGGIVLFATVNQAVNGVVNKLIKHVILEDRMEIFNSDSLAIEYRLDNEWELVFVVGYQKMLSLSYIDKFLDDIQLAFRDKFNDYDLKKYLFMQTERSDSPMMENDPLLSFNIVDFYNEFQKVYAKCCKYQKNVPVKEMKSFDESLKSKKTVASLFAAPAIEKVKEKAVDPVFEKVDDKLNKTNGVKKLLNKSPSSPKKVKEGKKEPKGKKTKEARQWELGGRSTDNLDFSKNGDEKESMHSVSLSKNIGSVSNSVNVDDADIIPDLELKAGSDDESDEEVVQSNKQKQSSFFGSFVKTFSYNKVLDALDLQPILVQLRDHLIGKNVASEIATKLCESVGKKLEGQQVNTWMGLKKYVRNSLEESVLRILSPNRNINILREIKAKSIQPYVITFCGVNGVGKSTNLAKIANWLILNNVKVLVIACDTFRAGAIEQLRTHVTALKSIHEKDGKNIIDLYEKGYGKDAAAIAMEAINYARTVGYNCCLVDTAGRMQDNEPLMKQLSKLIRINEPDLTLFVGEALVGNEAVDQLSKFNTSLLDHGCKGITDNSSAINGIVLTKFDTIDDQVGAAVSMTYITGQPIVFVGVGQTYRDLKQLNAKAVVKALMR